MPHLLHVWLDIVLHATGPAVQGKPAGAGPYADATTAHGTIPVDIAPTDLDDFVLPRGQTSK